MNKRKILCAIIIGASMLTVACSSKTNNLNNETIVEESEVRSNTKVNADAIKIDEISWVTTNTVYNDKTTYRFDYTNNSQYDILSVELKFSQKEGTTEEDLKILDPYRENQFVTDDEINNAYFLGYNRKMVRSGESSEGDILSFNGTYTMLLDTNQMSIMEPSQMDIAFVSDGKIYGSRYDFKTQTYSLYDSVKEAYEWPDDNELVKQLPKPEYDVVIFSGKYDTSVYFSIRGTNMDDFAAYRDLCKEKGFVNEVDENEKRYTATNDLGYEVNVKYNESETAIYVSIETE